MDNISPELQAEFERSAQASCISHPHGHADIAIDFENQIFGFPNYSKVFKNVVSYIYTSDLYTIVSHHDPVGRIDPNTGKLKIEGSLFATEDIWVMKSNGNEELLDTYSLNWVTSHEFGLSSFESKDFLEQTCISHSIWRIRMQNDSIEPWNNVRRRYAKEVENIKNAFLKVFEPRIRDVVTRFHRKYPYIELNAIHSKAFEIASILLIGENRKHIEQSVTKYHNEPSKKAENRKYFRDNSVHTLKSYKDDHKSSIDLVKKSAEALKDILFFAPRLDADTLLGLLQSDSYSSIISGAINRDSNRIYKPDANLNLAEFIFGKKGRYIPLFNYLKDYFKNDTKRHKKLRFNNDEKSFHEADNIEHQHLFKNSNQEDGPSYWLNDDSDNNSDFFRTSKKWKINIHNFTAEEIKLILPKKQSCAYSAWLKNSYNSNDTRERKNLERAKKKLLRLKIDVPLPSSQQK